MSRWQSTCIAFQHCIKPGIILNMCNGSALEAEAEVAEVQDDLLLGSSFKGSLDNVRLSKKEKKRKLKDKKSSK